MSVESSGKPDAWKLARPVWGWGRGETPWPTPHADLTAVPISGGFWTNWVPNAIWQRWPICWWLLNVEDHFSRRWMGFAVFKTRPDSEEVTPALDRIIEAEHNKPKHLIVDQGSEFKCEHFEEHWCKEREIAPRFGAVRKHGSISVVERLHKTIKAILVLFLIPEDQAQFEQELSLVRDWYNEHRAHETLGGKTPNEVFFSRPAANEQPRLEPRERWPRGSPCAAPRVPVKGKSGVQLELQVTYHANRKHLPVVTLNRAA